MSYTSETDIFVEKAQCKLDFLLIDWREHRTLLHATIGYGQGIVFIHTGLDTKDGAKLTIHKVPLGT
jgi:hypothetical protein